jgi:hypothetical protein
LIDFRERHWVHHKILAAVVKPEMENMRSSPVKEAVPSRCDRGNSQGLKPMLSVGQADLRVERRRITTSVRYDRR